ncbi:MAG: sulfite exporter TauE/SafE family protein [Pseudomonadales bacterium]
MLFDWVLLGVIVAFAGVVRGCIGFGFSALVVASGALFMPPAVVVPLVAILEIVASVHMAFSTWRDAAIKPLLLLLAGAAVATPIGVLALVYLPADDIRLLLSALIFALSLLLLSGWQYKGRVAPASYTVMGLFSGLCNGAAAVGGLPVATFLASVRLSMRELRATLVLFFFAADIIFILSASGHAIYTQSLVVLSAAMVVPMALGIHFGSALFHKLNEKTLRRSVIGLLLMLSVIGLVRGALSYL